MAIYCLEHLDNKSFLELTRRDFRNFMLHAQDEWHLSAARCNRELSMIHMMLAYCEDDNEEYEDYDRNASEKIKGIPKEEIRDIPNEVLYNLYERSEISKSIVLGPFLTVRTRFNSCSIPNKNCISCGGASKVLI